MEEVAWTLVRRKNKRVGKQPGFSKAKEDNHEGSTVCYSMDDSELDSSTPLPSEKWREFHEGDVEKLVNKISLAISEIEQSNFFLNLMGQSVKQRLLNLEFFSSEIQSQQIERNKTESPSVEVVVYGIGNISLQKKSMYQFSLAISIAKEVQGGSPKLLIFDPVLTELEMEAMKAFNVETIKFNEMGKRTVKEPTLFFMPHCDSFLYINLLEANFPPMGDLQRVVILGNSFTDYRESVITEKRRKEWDTFFLVEPITGEIRVSEQGAPIDSMFNSTSWHFFTAPGVE